MRAEIINSIIEEQKKIITNLEESVDRYKSASNLDDDNTHDPEDFSHQDEAKDMQLRFEQRLNEAKLNLDAISDSTNNVHTEIENGALIETPDNFIFIGISLPIFKHNGKDIITISGQAPIFQELKGKKVNDSITIGNNSHTIITIY
jgi:hypothetical protein